MAFRERGMLDVIDPGFDQIENDHDRSEAWTRAVSTVVQPTLVHGVPVPRFARFHSWKMGGLILNEIAAPAQVFERTEYQILSQGIDHIVVSALLSGRSVAATAEKEYFIPTGSIRITDLSQTYKLHSFGMRGLNIFVPRRYLGSWCENASSLHQLIVSPRKEPLARLLFDQVRNTHLCINYTDEAQRKLLAHGMVATLNAMLGSLPITKNETASSIPFDIMRFIEANLGRNDLSVDLLCSHFGLSRTPIYAIFEAYGGVMTYIRNRRLALAMRMLSGIDGNERKRVSEVAYDCGYDTLKAFSKAFKARYGMVPRDVDTASMDGSRREAGAAMLSWILEL